MTYIIQIINSSYQCYSYANYQLYSREMSLIKKNNYDIDCVFDGFNGVGAIYVSDYGSACSKQIRLELNIKAVISIASSGYLEHHHQLEDYMYIPAQDTDVYQISHHFQQTFNFLDKHRKNGNVLVHCMVGKSRSATIVAAYLLRKYKYSLQTVMNLLKRKRKKINPNPGFMKQLQRYCELLAIPKQTEGRCRSFQKSIISDNTKNTASSMEKNSDKFFQIKKQNKIEEKKQKLHINQRIQRIRFKYMKASTQKLSPSKNLFLGLKGPINNGSTCLPSNNISIDLKQTKSVQFQ